jgi:AraC-like DNA-binding protein
VSLRYLERPPPPHLAADIECVWEVRDRVAAARRQPERIVPDGCPELIVHLADVFARQVGGRWMRQPRAFLAGTLTRPWLVRAGRRVHTVGIRFKPAAAARLLGPAMEEAADRELALEQLVGRGQARALVGALRGAASIDARWRAVGRWLGARSDAAGPGGPGARPAVALILRARGRIRIAELARRLGWSRRRLERVFARDLGVRPKLYARIVRLNAVLAALEGVERSRAVDLALEAGYFDEAHLLRDFRFLAGRSPHGGREADGEMARHFTRPERLRALLDGE